MRSITTAISDRFELVELPPEPGGPTFAQEIVHGLRSTPMHLPTKYLYDAVGSALFDAITLLPEYYLTGAETQILREWGWQIVRLLDAPLEFVELGSGSAAKTRLLIEEALRVQGALRYSPIDISKEALRASSQALVEAYPGLSVRAYAGDYFDVLGSSELLLERKTLVMFMGSNIGNYEPAGAARLLELIASVLRPGDGLLLGADLDKDRATLERAYADPTGVTTAFNKNLLARINRQFDAAIDLGRFEHVARYDPARSSVDSFLVAQGEAEIDVPSLRLHLRMQKGERIHTESAYKFAPETIAAMGARAGLRLSHSWYDRKRLFSVHLLERA